ncbi:MAG: hypothetical protein ACLQVL_17070, partial [Terriglobia bacterium]
QPGGPALGLPSLNPFDPVPIAKQWQELRLRRFDFQCLDRWKLDEITFPSRTAFYICGFSAASGLSENHGANVFRCLERG